MGDNRKEISSRGRDREASTIKRLTKDLRDKVRSGCNIVSMEQCVQELVFNAIDAGASKIYVGINMKSFKVEVEDDGCGLSRPDLELVGKRYITSKWTSPDDLRRLSCYGYRGESLASIISVSNSVKILTRPRKANNVSTYRLWFWNGKVSDTGIEELRESKRSPGFTITVEGLLDSQPVRQKRVDRTVNLLDVRLALERIALVNPNISIEFRNESNMSTLLKYNPCLSHAEAFDQLFSTKKTDSFSFVTENHLQDGLLFSASIGKLMYRQKCFQYVFVNKRCIEMRNKIHRVMNDVLLKLLTNEQGTSGNGKDNKAKEKSSSAEKVFPVFILNVTCSLEKYCPQLDSKYGVEFFEWQSCIKGIEGLVLKFQSRVFPASSAVDVAVPINAGGKNLLEKTNNLNSSRSFQQTSFGHDISTRDVKNAVHSRPAIREAVQDHSSHENESNLSSPSPQPHVNELAARGNKTNKKVNPTRAKKQDTEYDSYGDDDKEEVLSTTYTDLVASPSMMMQKNKRFVPQPYKKPTTKHTVYNVRRRSPKNAGEGKKINFARGGVPRPRKDIVVAKNPVPILNRDVFSKFPPWSKKIVAPPLKIGSKRKTEILSDDNSSSSPQIVKKPKYGNMVHHEKIPPTKNSRNALFKHLIPEPRKQIVWPAPAGAGMNRKLGEKGVDDDEPKGRDWKLRRYLSDSQNEQQTTTKDLNDRSPIEIDDDDVMTHSNPSKPPFKSNQSPQGCCNTDSPITEISKLSLKIRSSAGSCAKSDVMSSGKAIKKRDEELPRSKKESPKTTQETDEDDFVKDDPLIEAHLASAQEFISSKNLHLAADISDLLRKNLKDKEKNKITESPTDVNWRRPFNQSGNAHDTADTKPSSSFFKKPIIKPPAAIGHHPNHLPPKPALSTAIETPDPYGINRVMKEYSSVPFSSATGRIEAPQPLFSGFNLNHSTSFHNLAGTASSFPFSVLPPAQQYQSLPMLPSSISDLHSNKYRHGRFPNWDVPTGLGGSDATSLQQNSLWNLNQKDPISGLGNPDILQEHSSYFTQPDEPHHGNKNNNRRVHFQNPLVPTFGFGRAADGEFGTESEYFASSPFPCVTEGNEDQQVSFTGSQVSYRQQCCPRDNPCSQEAPDTPIIEALMKPPLIEDTTTSPYFTSPSEDGEEDKDEGHCVRNSQESNVTIKEVTPSTDLDANEPLLNDENEVAKGDSDTEWGQWEVDIVSDANGQDWLQTVDEGKTVFINLSNGDLSYDMVNIVKWNRAMAASLTKSRGRNWLRRYFPKGCDQLWKRDIESHKPRINGNIAATTNHLSEKVKEYIVKSTEDPVDVFDKWRSDAIVARNSTASGQPVSLISTSSEYFGTVGNSAGDIHVTNLNGNGESRVYNTIMSKSIKFKKEDLCKLKVISQWDRKFIVAKLTVDDFDKSKAGVKGPKDILVILDQHAVHERIRLEKLVNDLHETDLQTGQKALARLRIDPPYKLNFMESEIRVLETNPESFKKIGLDVEVVNCTTVKISSAPGCIIRKAIAEPSPAEHTLALTKLLTDLIQEEIQKITDTKIVTAAAIPKTIFNILCSQACHGAIKFGDELELSVCEAMVSDLQHCKTPFQCAHGRPSLVPLMDLSSLLRSGFDNYCNKARNNLWRDPQRPTSSSSDTLTQSKPSVYFQGLCE